MSGVARKLLGGVLAISLFVSSSLSALAFVPSSLRFSYYDPSLSSPFVYYANSSNGKLYYPDTLPSVSNLRVDSTLDSSSLSFSSVVTLSYSFESSLSISSIFFNVASYKIGDSSYRLEIDIIDSSLVPVVNSGNTTYTASCSFLFNNLPVDYSVSSEIGLLFYDSNGNRISPDISNITFNFDIFDSSSPMPTPPPSGGGYGGIVGDIYGTVNSISGLVDLNVDWSGMTYSLTTWYSNRFCPFLIDLFSSVQSGFISLTGNIGSFFSSFFSRLDQQEDNYTSVTDPSTSQDIQEAQGMIDTVEGFESQLHANITTEFDKIDFTTPTNLAAPVAYIGDKVTRSMNSLGNYQPLIFVPLTLGIMLIMLGRGVTALGSMVSASSRAAARNRSQGDDS